MDWAQNFRKYSPYSNNEKLISKIQKRLVFSISLTKKTLKLKPLYSTVNLPNFLAGMGLVYTLFFRPGNSGDFPSRYFPSLWFEFNWFSEDIII